MLYKLKNKTNFYNIKDLRFYINHPQKSSILLPSAPLIIFGNNIYSWVQLFSKQLNPARNNPISKGLFYLFFLKFNGRACCVIS